MKRFACSLVLSVFFGNITFSQTPNAAVNDKNVTPDVMRFKGPNEPGVDAKGDLKIEVPLLTVPGRGLNMPLVARYASGIKMTQSASWIGLGWSLDLGSIVRYPRGGVNYPFKQVDFNAFGPDSIKSQPDFYVVNLPNGLTAGFYRSNKSSVTSLHTVPHPDSVRFKPVPWQPWKISFTTDVVSVDGESSWQSDYTSFTVTTEDGTRYLFGQPILARFKNDATNGSIKYVSTWRLLAIFGPNYSGPTQYDLIDPELGSSGDWVKISYYYGVDNNSTNHGIIYTANEGTDILHQLTYPQKIETPTHTLDFHISIRQDLDLKNWVSGKFYHKQLDSLKLYHRNNLSTPLKTIKFSYTTELFDKTTLKEITETGGSITKPSYKFSYYDDNELQWTSPTAFATLLENYADDFAFYNTSATYISRVWSLQKVVYPEGGYDEFAYENDDLTHWNDSQRPKYSRYSSSGSQSLADTYIAFMKQRQGGTRVTSIIRNDGASSQTTTYSYGDGYSSGIPDIAWRKIKEYSVSGELGQNSVFYKWVQKILPGGGKIKTFYHIGFHRKIIFIDGANTGQVAETVEDPMWGAADSVQYLNASNTLLKKEIYEWSSTPSSLADTAYIFGYALKNNVPSGAEWADLPLVFSEKQQTKLTTYQYESGQEMVHTKEFTYADDSGLFKSEREHRVGDQRRVATTWYAYEKSSGSGEGPIYAAMKNRNMLTQVAEERVALHEQDGEGGGGGEDFMLLTWYPVVYSSTATTWKEITGSEEDYLYVPGKVYRWRNPDPDWITDFNFNSPSEANSWVLTSTFETYNIHGNLLQFKDASNTITKSVYGHEGSVRIADFQNTGTGAVHADNFNDGSIADGNPFSWTTTDGPWSVTNGVLKSTYIAYAGNHTTQYQNFNAEVQARIIYDYANSNNWAAIHFASTSADYFNTGYMVYYRNNGNIALYSPGGLLGSEVQTSKPLNVWRRISLRVNGNNVQVFVDGERFINYTAGSAFPSGYLSLVTYRADSELDDFRSYPIGALATTYSYDPLTLQTTGTSEENNILAAFEYDKFNRLKRTVDRANNVIAEHHYYYSRSANADTLNPSDPNFIETAAYPQGASKDGLVGHWRLERDGLDETGNNNLNMVGTVWGRGYLGSAKTFDGTKTKYAHAPLISAYQTQRPTMTAWVKLSTNTTGLTIANVNVAGAWQDGRGFYLTTNSSGKALFIVGNASGSWKIATGATTLQTNTWYHVAGTYDGTYLRIYVNGVEDGSTNVGSITISYTPIANRGPNPSTFYIGIQHNADNTGPTDTTDLAYPFNGTIDEVKIYNRALSTSEIYSQYSAHVTTAYVDGIGRDIQAQARFGNDNIVTAKTYDSGGRFHKSYKPYQVSLGSNMHKFDPSFASNSSTYYPSDNGYTYTEFQYLSDPFNRFSKQGNPGNDFRIGSGHEIEHQYWLSNEIGDYAYKQIVFDEDNKRTYTLTDRFGDMVATMVDSGSVQARALYDYDIMKNLTSVLGQNSIIKYYYYNTFQLLRQKVTQDAGTWDYLYSKNGNLRFTTDGKGQYIYQKYDAFNRVVEVGQYTGSGSNITQANADSIAFPTSSYTLEKKFTYDVQSSDGAAAGQRNLMGKISEAFSYSGGSVVWTTFCSYDDYGRVEWVVQKHYQGSSWKIVYTYDIQGRVTQKRFLSNSNGYNLYTFYEYDQMGRTSKVYTDTVSSGVNKVKEAEYAYSATGKVKQLKLGATPAQTTDYTYNQRDWLTAINDIASLGSDTYAEKISYNTSALGGAAFYNGNISSVQSVYADQADYGYSFTYDGANRMTSAQAWLLSGSWATTNKYRISSVTYDVAGNILTMQRYGVNATLMDNLTYNYIANTNKLNYIDDAVAGGTYSVDLDDQATGNYTYDGNGNTTKDSVSGITSITYNLRNLPSGLTKSGTTYSYRYDASDVRVSAAPSSGGRYYVNGADGRTEAVVDITTPSTMTHNIYGNDMVGQVKRSGSTLSRYYYLKDHLGSIRSTINTSNVIVGRDDYDPWGMILEGRSYVSSADARFGYISKERDAETGNYWLDVRPYVPNIGRFLTPDPLMDKAPLSSWSPYHYSYNNPVRYKDPDGMSGKDVIGTQHPLVKFLYGLFSNSNRFADEIDRRSDKSVYDKMEKERKEREEELKRTKEAIQDIEKAEIKRLEEAFQDVKDTSDPTRPVDTPEKSKQDKTNTTNPKPDPKKEDKKDSGVPPKGALPPKKDDDKKFKFNNQEINPGS